MNRPRDKERESYDEYRENLREESRRLREYLRGRVFWQSSVLGQYKK